MERLQRAPGRDSRCAPTAPRSKRPIAAPGPALPTATSCSSNISIMPASIAAQSNADVDRLLARGSAAEGGLARISGARAGQRAGRRRQPRRRRCRAASAPYPRRACSPPAGRRRARSRQRAPAIGLAAAPALSDADAPPRSSPQLRDRPRARRVGHADLRDRRPGARRARSATTR